LDFVFRCNNRVSLGSGSYAIVKAGICLADNTKWAVKIIQTTKLNETENDYLEQEVCFIL
jgi:hypothetical protein